MIVIDVTAHDRPPASKLALGCAPLGNLYAQVSDGQANRAVRAALRSGIRYFDTAPHYGLGLSERRLGHALEGRARNTFLVSTKVGRLLRRNPAPTGSDLANGFAVPDDLARVPDYSRDGVRRSIAESLARLRLDYIDIALVHDPDDNMDEAITETIPALLELRDEGVVKAVGAGMNDWLALMRLVEETDLDTVMIAGRWTLLDRSGAPLLDLCGCRSVSVLAAAPFNSGILASNTVRAGATFNYAAADRGRLGAARRLADICRDYRVDLAAAALQFPLRHPAVTAVVCGMRSQKEVTADTSLVSAPIPSQCWEELERDRVAY